MQPILMRIALAIVMGLEKRNCTTSYDAPVPSRPDRRSGSGLALDTSIEGLAEKASVVGSCGKFSPSKYLLKRRVLRNNSFFCPFTKS